MTESTNDIAGLFSSLRPESVDDREASKVAVREAMLRWPLLRSLQPATTPTIAALTAQEKERRRATDSTQFAAPRRALSLPSAGNQLEQNLAKMVARARTHAQPEATTRGSFPTSNSISLTVPAHPHPLDSSFSIDASTGSKAIIATSAKPQPQ